MALRSLPRALGVVVLGAAACGGPPSPSDAGLDGGRDAGTPTDNPDGGPRLCPESCGILHTSDGGIFFYEDGGAYCLC